MIDLFQRNYQAVIDRGLITNETTDEEFFDKLKEESKEVKKEIRLDESLLRLDEEIADCLIVCSNWLMHRGVNLRVILTKIAEKNERRAKENNP